MNRADFQQLADLRIAEAECLLSNGFFEGAYHLAGYSVECGLKACIARRVNRFDFPDKNFAENCYTHDLTKLFNAAALSEDFKTDRKNHMALQNNWTIVKDWREVSRYESEGTKGRNVVEAFIKAITDASEIEEISQGILSWIKRRW